MVRLVLFDIDGTLIRTGGAGKEAFVRVAATEFHQPNGMAHIAFAGRTDPSIVREFFTGHGIPPTPENFRRFFDPYVFWLDHLLSQCAGSVLPGVREALQALQQMAVPPLPGLLTGNIRLGAEIKLRHFGLWSHFVVGGFGDDHEDRTQIARVVRDRGSRLLGVPLRGEEVLVVGDTPHDISCGRAIGAKVLAVATGPYPVEQLEGLQPTWAVRSLAEVDLPALCA